MEDKPKSGRWRGFITRRNAKRKTEREQEGSEIVQTVITLGFALGIGAALVLLQGPIQDAISDAGDKTASTFAEMTGTSVGGGGAGGGGAVETPDDDPIETVGTLSKSRFQTYMGENQNATELTFDAVSYDGMAYTDVSEEQNGSILAFMDGDTMHVTAANGGKVGMPADCSNMFYNNSINRSYLSNTSTFDMSNCDTSNVTNMRYMFCESETLSFLNLSGWNTSNVTDMFAIFRNCPTLSNLQGLENWDTSKVTNMGYMFSNCSTLISFDLSSWNTSNVDNMSRMFINCTSLQSLDLSGWDMSHVTDINYMFSYCSSLTEINGLENWNTSNITTMEGTFWGVSLTSFNISGWDTSSVTNMKIMFRECQSLTSLDLSGWDTSSVTNMSHMFEYCESLESLNLSGWNTLNTIDISYIFRNCTSLTEIKVGDGWDTSNADTNYMFWSCGTDHVTHV